MGDSKVIPPAPGRAAIAYDRRMIGALLVDAGRLRIQDAERILQLQRQRKDLRFGDAALQLGVLTEADIDFALSRQFDFPSLRRGETAVSEEVMTAFASPGPQVEAIRALRSQLMLRWLDGDPAHKTLAIVSATPKEGRSFIASNLAVAFCQLGQRTLLVDADLRNPCQHRLFGIDNRIGLSAVLSGRAGPETVQRIPALPSLSLLPAGATPPNPADLLGRQIFAELLHQLALQLDVIVIDTSPAAETADAQIVAVRAGAALIVARKNAARKWRIRGVSESVAQGRVQVVGAVLNSY